MTDAEMDSGITILRSCCWNHARSLITLEFLQDIFRNLIKACIPINHDIVVILAVKGEEKKLHDALMLQDDGFVWLTPSQAAFLLPNSSFKKGSALREFLEHHMEP